MMRTFITLLLVAFGTFQWHRAVNAMDEIDQTVEEGQTMRNLFDKQLVDDVANLEHYLNAPPQPKQLATKIRDVVRTIDGILDEYGIDKTAIAFNGGKDSTLLLHLVRICVTKKFGPDTKINAFFIKCDDEFSDLVHFVHKMTLMYNLNMTELCGPMRQGLALYKHQQPHVVAALMGTRSTDPIGKYMHSNIQWADNGWPHFLRVCPLFDWSYSEVWKGIIDLHIPYCKLYDEGYSSLGECSKTVKNPALLIEGSENRYKPAHSLNDGTLERANRDQ